MLAPSLKPVLFLLVALLVLGSCTRPEKLLERGNYEGAISASIKKLSGKKKKKVKHVKALEDAFSRVTTQDMREIKVLEKEGRTENWVEINRIHRRIKLRQEMIEPLLPLYASDGYKADFKFVKVEELELDSKKKAADYYYSEGKRYMSEAERGDKQAARKAYENFEDIQRYYKSYKDEEKLMLRARELGTNYVLFKMENDSRTILPKDFEREIKRISVRDLDSDWRQVHLNPDAARNYDYTVVMRLTQIEVSPDLVKEREYIDDKTIEEGWEYVLDAKGNVMKDTAGNDIKIPKKVLIKARVFESYQHKAAHVGGKLEFFDNTDREIIHTEPLAVDAIFENYAAKFDGDKRALTEDSKKKIGNQPRPFPSSEALVLQAADLLKPIVKDKIARSRVIR
ncbi:MAG: hypothetical protein IPN76_09860 [Saprospiraceae bacterium]|nr:hypothetical protein [Saprospiraceae bacterium]